jgi:hypothetical protein
MGIWAARVEGRRSGIVFLRCLRLEFLRLVWMDLMIFGGTEIATVRT